MPASVDHATAPSRAERVLSVLAAAGSLTVTTHGHRCELTGLHSLGAGGRLLLHAPPDSHLTLEVAHAPHGRLAAGLEFTDIAPTAVRDRVRARVGLRGRLTLATAGSGPGVLRFDPGYIELTSSGQTDRAARAARADRACRVAVGELAGAEPDPLARFEAATLTHLESHHPEAVALLARLVDPALLHGVRRVCPLALDRYGMVLRLEYPDGHRDVRLPFPGPARDTTEIEHHVQVLLLRARGCPRRRVRRP